MASIALRQSTTRMGWQSVRFFWAGGGRVRRKTILREDLRNSGVRWTRNLVGDVRKRKRVPNALELDASSVGWMPRRMVAGRI